MVVTASPRYPAILKGIKEKDVKELIAKLNKLLKEKADLPPVRLGESKAIDVFLKPTQSTMPLKNRFRSGKVLRTLKTCLSTRQKSVAFSWIFNLEKWFSIK